MSKKIRNFFRTIAIKSAGISFDKNENSSTDITAKSKSSKSDRLNSILAVVSVILLIAYILITAGARLQAQVNRDALPRVEYEQQEELLAELRLEYENLTAVNSNLQNSYDENRAAVFQNLELEDSPEVQDLLDQYRFTSRMAGMMDYQGQGVRIVLEDKAGIAYDSTTQASEIVHDGDIRYIADFFKRWYVDSINVNTERLSAMSPLICTGPSVLVNRVYHSPPYVFEVGIDDIGAQDLIDAFNEDSIIQSMHDRGLQLSIEFVEDMSFPGFSDEQYMNIQIEKLGGING